jgi:hypothetical protein
MHRAKIVIGFPASIKAVNLRMARSGRCTQHLPSQLRGSVRQNWSGGLNANCY